MRDDTSLLFKERRVREGGGVVWKGSKLNSIQRAATETKASEQEKRMEVGQNKIHEKK